MDKKKKAALQKQEDQALTRALVWFAAAMVVEFLLLLVNNIYSGNQYMLAYSVMKSMYIIAGVCLVGAVACGAWFVVRTRAKKELAFVPMVLTVTLLVMSVSAVLVRITVSALGLLCVLVPAGAVLALVYYLYQREFFLSVCAVAVSMLGLWLIRKNSGAHDLVVTAYVVLAALALIALVILAVWIKKNNGVLKLCCCKYTFNPKNGGMTPVMATGLICLAALVAGLLTGAVAAFYLLFALLAVLLVLLAYYTVKLM